MGNHSCLHAKDSDSSPLSVVSLPEKPAVHIPCASTLHKQSGVGQAQGRGDRQTR